MNGRCRIEMLGGLRVRQGERTIDRFRTQKVATLLAYLACRAGEDHPREVLTELLWPETEPRVGRPRLRQALSSLRLQLEPPGVTAGTVLQINRFAVRLNPPAVTTDVLEFEQHVHAQGHTREPAERLRVLSRAVDLYQGEFLPGFYDDWVLREQRRLTALFLAVVHQLVELLEEAGELESAIRYAVRAVNVDALNEESQADLIRLYVADGQMSAARAQYEELARVLRDELGREPAPATRRLIDQTPIIETPARRRPRPRAHLESPPPAAAADSRTEREVARPQLPLQSTRFFGREAEIGALQAALSLPSDQTPSPRLLTLTGPAGCGKTRLAIEAAGRLAIAYGSAVWFVPLASLPDPGLIPGAILDALEVQGAGADPLDQAIAVLSQRPSLLVLDNLEHLLGRARRGTRGAGEVAGKRGRHDMQNRDARADSAVSGVVSQESDASDVVRRLLGSLPALAVLATSRRILGLSGEREYPVPPLPTPRSRAGAVERKDRGAAALLLPNPHTPRELVTLPSVQLFVDRAQAVKPDFQVTERNAAAIAELCVRLEGIPLAIELAAARARMLTPAQMLEQMGDRFDLLVSRRRDVEERHRSLAAAIAWSYELLSPELQRFFCRLSVFRGGWTAEAAEAVCGSVGESEDGSEPPMQPHSRAPTLGLLEHLRESSLIQAEERDGAMRYFMLESLREFARHRLTAARLTAVQRTHADYYRDLAHLPGRPRPIEEDAVAWGAESWNPQMAREMDNLRAALAWYIDEGNDLHSGDRLVGAMLPMWHDRGPWQEGERRLAEVLERNRHAPPVVLSGLLQTAGLAAFLIGDYAASWARYEESLVICRRIGHDAGVASALESLGGMATIWKADYGLARSLLEEGTEYARRSRGRTVLYWCLWNLAFLAEIQGDAELGERVAAERESCRELLQDEETRPVEVRLLEGRRRGNKREVAVCLAELSDRAAMAADYENAREKLMEALQLYRELGDTRKTATAMDDLGRLCVWLGEYERGATYLEEALRRCREIGDKRLISIPLGNLAESKLRQGDLAGARTLLEESLALSRAVGFMDGVAKRLRLLGVIECMESHHDASRAWLSESIRIARTAKRPEWAIETIEAFAMLEAKVGAGEPAARLLGCAMALREEFGRSIPPCDRPLHAEASRSIRAALGERAFREYLLAGREMKWEEGVAYALRDAGMEGASA